MIFVPHDQARYQTLEHSLLRLESLGKNFDIFILSHGYPSRLSDGDKGYFLSWKELEAFKGKLSYLNLVFMQACYGTSLAEDWHQAGAETVISYPDLNRNFLFIDLFLRFYRFNPDQPQEAYRQAKSQLPWHLENKILYIKILDVLEITPEEYLEISPYPDFSIDL